jgi:hypothetical protein
MFQGDRDSASKLWMVDLAIFQPKSQSASPAVEVNNKQEFVSFWHAAFGYPTKSSFIRNIKNGNIQIDNLSAELVRKHFVPSIFTAFGHLDATRSNIKSTKAETKTTKQSDHVRPLIWLAVQESVGKLHADQTGPLPILGRHKEKYISIFYDEHTNYIHAEPIIDKSSYSLLAATQKALQFFKDHGSITSDIRLDNEISAVVRQHLLQNNIKVDLTPAGQHRRNKAERAIRTYKNHHVATVAGFDKDCPMELWSDCLEQIELTINLLRTSPGGSSAWAAVHGQFDFIVKKSHS